MQLVLFFALCKSAILNRILWANVETGCTLCTMFTPGWTAIFYGDVMCWTGFLAFAATNTRICGVEGIGR